MPISSHHLDKRACRPLVAVQNLLENKLITPSKSTWGLQHTSHSLLFLAAEVEMLLRTTLTHQNYAVRKTEFPSNTVQPSSRQKHQNQPPFVRTSTNTNTTNMIRVLLLTLLLAVSTMGFAPSPAFRAPGTSSGI
jgi:hypothetical protein